MTAIIITLPDGTIVRTESRKSFHVVGHGRRLASSNERGIALAMWRREARRHGGSVWLLASDGTVVRPLSHDERSAS